MINLSDGEFLYYIGIEGEALEVLLYWAGNHLDWKGVIYSVLIGFGVLVAIAFFACFITRIKINYQFMLLRKYLFATTIMSDIREEQIYKDRR